MKKIEIYLLIQILKSFFLIFFIFIGISWLLQTTRLMSLVTIHNIPILKVFLLSLNIIPNVIVNIFPFVVFISILLTSIKFYRDKELIAIYSLNIPINKIIKPFIFFSFICLLTSLILSFVLSPHYYGIFKKNEFELRTNLDINNIGLNNFYYFNNNILINFEKKSDQYVNILIFQEKPKKIIIIAKRAEMELKNNILNLKLYNGYKTEIKNIGSETLLYDKYNFSVDLDNNETYNNSDKNTFGLLKLIKQDTRDNYLIINQRFVDSLLLISLIYLIIKYIFIKIKFNINHLLLISLSCFGIIFLDNILGNLSTNNSMFIILMYCNILLPILPIYSIRKKI